MMMAMSSKGDEIEKGRNTYWTSDKFQSQLQREEYEGPITRSRSKEESRVEQPCLKRRRKFSGSGIKKREPGEIHPLFIDHILENVLDHCSDYVSSVKQFRLVCKHWNYIATKRYRATHGRICFENDFNRKTSKFIEVMQNSTDMLFDKFKFSGGFVLYKPYKGQYGFDRVFNKLFKIAVPWMKSLEFSMKNPSDLQFPKTIQHYDLSNLTTLSFHVIVFYSNLQAEMADYLGDILDSATSLKEAVFRLIPTDPSLRSTSQMKIMDRFGIVIATKIPKTCTHLKLNMLMNDNHITILEKRGLQLECLIIDFHKTIIRTKVIEDFLKSQSNSLKHLEFIEARTLDSTMKFPVLPNLLCIKIEGKPRIPSFKLETTFPKLKSIDLLFYWIYQDDNWLKNVLEDSGQSKSVVDVEFLCEINEKDLFILYRIVKSFPVLKRLCLYLNTSLALPIVFSEMSFLEDLEVSIAREFWISRGLDHLMGTVDSGFCGLSAELCIQLLKDNDFTSTDLPETLSGPSIRDLKKLKTLKIRGFCADQIPLTDVTVHYGLMKMKSLTHVILDVFPISKQCLAILGQHVKLRLLPGPPIFSERTE